MRQLTAGKAALGIIYLCLDKIVSINSEHMKYFKPAAHKNGRSKLVRSCTSKANTPSVDLRRERIYCVTCTYRYFCSYLRVALQRGSLDLDSSVNGRQECDPLSWNRLNVKLF
jgi:hypothetical protein